MNIGVRLASNIAKTKHHAYGLLNKMRYNHHRKEMKVQLKQFKPNVSNTSIENGYMQKKCNIILHTLYYIIE